MFGLRRKIQTLDPLKFAEGLASQYEAHNWTEWYRYYSGGWLINDVEYLTEVITDDDVDKMEHP
jgi:hypothetical protein